VTAKSYFGHVLGEGDLHEVGSIVKNGLEYEGVLTLVVLVLIAVALVVAARRERRVPPLVVLGALAVGLNVAITVLNSGDWMEHRRLLVPVLPLLVLLAPWSARVLAAALGGGARRVAALAAPPLACVLVVLAAGFDPASTPRDPHLTEIGRALAGERARVLTNVAGVMPWYAGSDTYVWDILGLTDEHNSRHGEVFSPRYGRTDPEYDFSRPFDVFVSNAPLDPALMVLEWRDEPARFRDYSAFVPSAWTNREIYVFARRDTPVEAALAEACGCEPAPISARLREQLLARAERAGAIPLE
jgi:hypothetical protein